MKNFAFAASLLLASSAVLTACYNRDRDPMPEYSSVGLVKATIDPATDTISYIPARAAPSTNPTRPNVTFTIDLYSQRDVKITKLYIYRTLRRGTTTFTYSPRFLLDSITTFPTTVTYNSQQLLTGMVRLDATTNPVTAIPYVQSLPTSPNRIFQTDSFIFTYEYVLENGKRIVLTPTTNTKVTTAATPTTPATTQTYGTITGSQILAPYALVVPIR